MDTATAALSRDLREGAWSRASSNLKEVHFVGAGLVPARTGGGCGLQGGHQGRPYEGKCLRRPFNLVDALH
jgi:hypothetical protein